MYSDIKVDWKGEVPASHITTKHAKRCKSKDKPSAICCDHSWRRSENIYQALYMCHECWHGQSVFFRIERESD